MSRILVTGKYVSTTEYLLYKEDGTVYKSIREGVPFRFGKQQWIPVKVPKKKGVGTILVCRNYDENFNVIEEFPLFHCKRGLWAVTSKSAINGVFHNYNRRSDLEKFLNERGISSKVIKRVRTFNEILDMNKSMCITDGKVTNMFNDGMNFINVIGGTYAIHCRLEEYSDINIFQIIIKDNIDENVILKKLKIMLEYDN